MTYREVFADRDILYGGVWIDDSGEYADVVEVTDLDSAAGTRDMVNVTVGSVGLYGRDFAENRRRVEEAFRSFGGFKLTGLSRQARRNLAWYALWSYGYRDIDQDHILATARDYDSLDEDWKLTTINGYPQRVNGEKGLRRWLARYADLDVDAASQPEQIAELAQPV